jgi:hypothetical protein
MASSYTKVVPALDTSQLNTPTKEQNSFPLETQRHMPVSNKLHSPSWLTSMTPHSDFSSSSSSQSKTSFFPQSLQYFRSDYIKKIARKFSWSNKSGYIEGYSFLKIRHLRNNPLKAEIPRWKCQSTIYHKLNFSFFLISYTSRNSPSLTWLICLWPESCTMPV